MFLKSFGCTCYPWLKPYVTNKLSPKSQSCVFLGYCSNTKGYRCYDPLANKVFISRHVRFIETKFPYLDLIKSVPSDSASDVSSFNVPLTSFEEIVVTIPCSPVFLPPQSTSSSPLVSSVPVSITSDSFCIPSSIPVQPPFIPTSSNDPVSYSPIESVPSSTQAIPTSSLPAIPPETFHPIYPSSSSSLNIHSMQTRSKSGIVKPKHPFALTLEHSNTTVPDKEPNNFIEAIKHPVWQQAMHAEYQALVKQGTWILVPPPLGANIIGCQWIYKIKRHSDGTMARYKARLVANGNQQTEGIDFQETFSPVIKQPTIRIVLSLAVHYKWPIKQLDVSNAFLHGLLDEEVYMKQPLGYKDPQHPSFVCKLSKALYGLRQAPRAWFSAFSGFLLQQGFMQSKSDSSLFISKKDVALTLVLVYVDDILVTGSDMSYTPILIL